MPRNIVLMPAARRWLTRMQRRGGRPVPSGAARRAAPSSHASGPIARGRRNSLHFPGIRPSGCRSIAIRNVVLPTVARVMGARCRGGARSLSARTVRNRLATGSHRVCIRSTAAPVLIDVKGGISRGRGASGGSARWMDVRPRCGLLTGGSRGQRRATSFAPPHTQGNIPAPHASTAAHVGVSRCSRPRLTAIRAR